MKLHFYGGAGSVTGANYLLETGDLGVLVDCGLFQGTRFSESLNYEEFRYNPRDVDYLLITHSHVDHIGRIPKLYRAGFRGQIITTEPTAAIIPVALEDTVDKLLEEAKETGRTPLFRKDHLREAMKLLHPVRYGMPINLHGRATVTFHEASHILGSAIIEIEVREPKTRRRLVFSGDLGNPPTPLLNPIDYVADADYVVIESAYGNRIHEDRHERRNILQEVIATTINRGGILMIPSFAVERIQELLLELNELFIERRIPSVPVFVDSPLASKITDVYGRFSRYFNADAMHALQASHGLFRFPWLTFTRTVAESKQINNLAGPKIIIAGSGMSQGGRIIHHELRYLPDPKNTILFVGYQVQGSRGRRILDHEPHVTIEGRQVPVRCEVRAIGGYSAHADQNGLLEFVRRANQGRGVKQVFVVQGEQESAQVLAEKITADLRIPALVPQPDTVVAI